MIRRLVDYFAPAPHAARLTERALEYWNGGGAGQLYWGLIEQAGPIHLIPGDPIVAGTELRHLAFGTGLKGLADVGQGGHALVFSFYARPTSTNDQVAGFSVTRGSGGPVQSISFRSGYNRAMFAGNRPPYVAGAAGGLSPDDYERTMPPQWRASLKAVFDALAPAPAPQRTCAVM